MTANIVIIDDDDSIRYSLGSVLKEEGYKIHEAADGATALVLLGSLKKKQQEPDLIFLDIRLPDIDGMALLGQVKQKAPNASIFILTGFGTVPQSVEAMKKGVTDYLLKPFSINEIVVRVRKCFDNRATHARADNLAEINQRQTQTEFVIGPNPAMQKVHETLETIAASPNTTVLIHGETGTGKEVIAQRLHSLSPRKNAPYVGVNASALTVELLESELFGHEEGAFTGAYKAKKGLFEVASGGTLFLDEIGDMDLTMQAKVLRAIEERKIRRVGGTVDIPVDIRLITASNKNLREEVKKGKFREDLYYRLNVVPVELPPLRERPEDIEMLANFFLAKYNSELGREVEEISPAVLAALQAYNWPGNIRELRNVIERALLLECKGKVLSVNHLHFDRFMGGGVRSDTGSADANMSFLRIGENCALDVIEREHIEKVLSANGGNKNQAAQVLGIDRTTLYNKLKKYQAK